ncbi:MAG: hypothetical protein QW292_07690 [Candidatus Parvarchaeota archaeon]
MESYGGYGDADLDVFSLTGHKESTIKETLFIFLLSIIIKSALLRK